jgi:hypothetical protein
MKRRTLLKALLAWPLAGCGPSTKEKQVIQKLTENMQTHCIGRFLFDLPKGFIQYPDAEVILYYGRDKNFTTVEVKVLEHGVNRAGFDAHVKKRAGEIGSKMQRELNVPMLAAQTKVGENSVLLRAFEDDSINDTFLSYLIILVDDILVQAKEKSFEGKFAPAEARLQKLATQLSKPQDPTKGGKGFCLGPLLIAADHDYEMVKFEYDNPDLDAVSWEITSTTLAARDGGLLSRVDSNAGMLKQAGAAPDLVRRGQIPFAGMK